MLLLHSVCHIVLYIEEELREFLVTFFDTMQITYMDILISTSFMRPHATKDTKIGHENEPIIMENAIKKSLNDPDALIHKILFISQTGLIQNKKCKQMHASPDYIGLAEINGAIKPIFVEIKCRTRNKTALLEQKLISHRNPRFIGTVAGDESCHKNIIKKSEKMQLLHQAATTEINNALFLIGDRNGTIIRGIWIHFPDELIEAYQTCIGDIHNNNFEFTSNAIEGDNNPLTYINSDTKEQIEQAIQKQTYVDWDSFIYGFKMWVALRKLQLPLLSSRQVLPVPAALWNRSKNGSDVATGMIRGAWFPLPAAARTPGGLVVQRILYLIQINILKIGSILLYSKEADIDKFRKKTNKINGSFRTFGLKLRNSCISARLMDISNRKTIASSQARVQDEEDTSHSKSHNATASVTPHVNRRTLRSNNMLQTYQIDNPSSIIKITGLTPTSRSSKDSKKRAPCRMPMLVPLCDDLGKAKNGKACALCSRRTKFWCIGCHQFFCNDVQKNPNMYKKEIDDSIKGAEDLVSVNLGHTTKWRKVETQDGTIKRRPIQETSGANFKFTCHVRAHLHLLEDTSHTQVARKIEI